MSDERKLKVLVSAYACEPDKGSEPGVGWNWAKQIARFHEVWVITRANNRDSIERVLQKEPIPNLHFVYYDVPKWLSFWKKKTRGLYLYYLLWQIGAYRVAKKLHKSVGFDVVHHLTFGNLWLPTFMSFLPIPFIWGPIGGGEEIPLAFWKKFPLNAKIKECLRSIIISSLKINPLFKYNSYKSSLIIAKTTDTANRFNHRYKSKIVVETDVAVDSIALKQDKNSHNNCVQLIAVGRLDAWRGFDLLIRAFAKVNKIYNNVCLYIIGDGSEMKRLKKLREHLNLTDKIIFTGHIDKKKYWEHMRGSDIFVNPCLKEGGVTALFDALSLGMPVICMDIAGASEIVKNECGIKVKPVTPDQTIKDLADAIVKLARNPELRSKMGETGRKRVEEVYSWERKGDLIKSIYEKICNDHSNNS